MNNYDRNVEIRKGKIKMTDDNGNYIGEVREDGMIFFNNGSYGGYIGQDGSYFSPTGEYRGKIE